MDNLAQHLHHRLSSRPDHPRFSGLPVDITSLTALELGSLWALLQSVRLDDAHPACSLARSVLSQADALALRPAFDLPAANAALALLDPVRLPDAIDILAALATEPGPELAAQLEQCMGKPELWAARRYECHVLARVIGPAAQARLRTQVALVHRDAPILLREFALLDELSWNAVLALAGSRLTYYWMGDTDSMPDPATMLASEPAYIGFAEAVLTEAARHAASIHTGATAYVADGAFALDESAILARAARVAAINDEPWLGATMQTLLPKVCVAPTAAKTAPSQSLSIALAHAIEAVPTPETIDALREAIGVVRHAGVARKIARNLKPAERALATRPDLALRGATLSVPGKRERTTLARCLEAGFLQRFALPWPQWQAQLAGTTLGKTLARELIWWLADEDGRQAFMLDAKGRPTALDGTLLAAGEAGTVELWHPAAPDAARAGWQAHVTARQLRQPLRQAFRETYSSGTPGTDFAGHALSLRPLIGLARREGWRIERHGLTRIFGAVRVSLPVNATLYPGVEGWGETLAMTFQRRAGAHWESVLPAVLDPIVFSEACRAVDLLVSVSAFAIAGDSGDEQRLDRLHHLSQLPLGEMAAMRRQVLSSAFKDVHFSERHAHVAGHTVHLATGRVAREGGQVEIALDDAEGGKLVALPWLPYDEALLEKLVLTIGALLSRQV